MFSFQLTTTAPLLTNRGVINQLMGYLPCAMKDYQQAISVDPDYALAYFNAANIYFHNRQFSQVSLQSVFILSSELFSQINTVGIKLSLSVINMKLSYIEFHGPLPGDELIYSN